MDYEYKGNHPMHDQVDEFDKRPPLHTNLTTSAAVTKNRQLNLDIFEVLIKTIPGGPVVQLRLERRDSVGFLHHLLRTNSQFGGADDAVLFLPTMNGLFCMDNDEVRPSGPPPTRQPANPTRQPANPYS